jgi:hypothetical protein
VPHRRDVPAHREEGDPELVDRAHHLEERPTRKGRATSKSSSRRTLIPMRVEPATRRRPAIRCSLWTSSSPAPFARSRRRGGRRSFLCGCLPICLALSDPSSARAPFDRRSAAQRSDRRRGIRGSGNHLCLARRDTRPERTAAKYLGRSHDGAVAHPRPRPGVREARYRGSCAVISKARRRRTACARPRPSHARSGRRACGVG